MLAGPPAGPAQQLQAGMRPSRLAAAMPEAAEAQAPSCARQASYLSKDAAARLLFQYERAHWEWA